MECEMTDRFSDKWPRNDTDSARRHRESFAMLAEKQGERDKSLRAFEEDLRKRKADARAEKGLPPDREGGYDWFVIFTIALAVAASLMAVILAWVLMTR